MERTTPQRKPPRLKDFDYNSTGAYFITLCTQNRRNYFWKNVGATIGRPQDIELSRQGIVVDEAIHNIHKIYPAVSVDCYVIMPNHIHLLLSISADEYGRPMVAPTISRVVQQLKGYITKRIGNAIWQKLFYDHIIRNREDYEEHWRYICENPLRWQTDELYMTE
ncbi:MAG: transposase [Clostridia bacterium]|nr:transposase [Clostridia bacterium]